ncbi:hypothetical protein GQ53DRAFT_879948 [Thozetella sp. PMI_491]|nr:hypothetical protein GQ53DRAFT_879948 [Thozetella sp. PMI_491]
MSERRNSLSPPTKSGLEDPGARDLDSSDSSDEHFSDAQSGLPDSHRTSPIPKTRVEKVDDEPSYGEVPGTEAYRLREEDAEPDEIAIVPDQDSKPASDEVRSTPGGQPVPTTLVEETPDEPESKRHPEIEKKHRADPPPDLVLRADGKTEGGSSDSPISPSLKTPGTARSRRKSSSAARRTPLTPGLKSPGFVDEEQDDDDFGDDFDDFEEGDDDADFGDFDDGFEQPQDEPTPAPAPQPQAPAPAATLSFPIPDFEDLDSNEILAAAAPYINALFPPEDALPPSLPPPSKDHPIFLTSRSASLWSQLVAPPPLQPPDWIRSRIRRLFLVSLGVPVDLDEILPASKQKKLVLPSLHRVSSNGSLRTSTDSRSISRLKSGEANASNTSLDSQGKPKAEGSGTGTRSSSKKRKGPPPEPAFDLVAAKQLCTTTEEALNGMTDTELQGHIRRLGVLEGTAKEVLEYWTKRTDEKIGDREAFEGVIENLVKHARKTRK